jgi:hypothetical protein
MSYFNDSDGNSSLERAIKAMEDISMKISL